MLEMLALCTRNAKRRMWFAAEDSEWLARPERMGLESKHMDANEFSRFASAQGYVADEAQDLCRDEARGQSPIRLLAGARSLV
jgi:hypothetical protein